MSGDIHARDCLFVCSTHAVARASERLRVMWKGDRLDEDETISQWLCRIAHECLADSVRSFPLTYGQKRTVVNARTGVRLSIARDNRHDRNRVTVVTAFHESNHLYKEKRSRRRGLTYRAPQ